MGQKITPPMEEYITHLNKKFKGLRLEEAFEALASENFKNLAFSTSFGLEDQVLTHHIFSSKLPIEVFTLDTGRLFEETYEVFHTTQKKYNTPIITYFPEAKDIEQLLAAKGPFSFYNSVEDRKECCHLRKVKPLQRSLQGVDLWITGLRAEQSNARQKLRLFQYNDAFGLIKFNPLAHWTLEAVETYIKDHKVPQNKLHQKGYVSIGCAPCTRAITPGEDLRAGRWWWETSKKECGLHLPANA